MEDWAELDEIQCPCHGCGWAETSKDKWSECPIHFEGQLHPNTRTLLLDEPNRLSEEEKKSRLRFQIQQAKTKVNQFQDQLKQEQSILVKLELELINRTPTVRAMQAVVPMEPEPFEIQEEDFI